MVSSPEMSNCYVPCMYDEDGDFKPCIARVAFTDSKILEELNRPSIVNKSYATYRTNLPVEIEYYETLNPKECSPMCKLPIFSSLKKPCQRSYLFYKDRTLAKLLLQPKKAGTVYHHDNDGALRQLNAYVVQRTDGLVVKGNGQCLEQREILDKPKYIKHGEQVTYYQERAITVKNFNLGVRDGKWKEVEPELWVVTLECNYKDGKLDGEYIRRSATKTLLHHAFYKDGLLVGIENKYHPEYNMSTLRSRNDKGFLHGKQVIIEPVDSDSFFEIHEEWENGVKTGAYVKDLVHKEGALFRHSVLPVSNGRYTNGNKTGVWYEYEVDLKKYTHVAKIETSYGKSGNIEKLITSSLGGVCLKTLQPTSSSYKTSTGFCKKIDYGDSVTEYDKNQEGERVVVKRAACLEHNTVGSYTLHGHYKYDWDGVLIEGEFWKGKRHGTFIRIVNGQVISRSNHVYGKRDGDYYSYDNGVTSQGTYKMGKKHGVWMTVQADGTRIRQEFEYGCPVGMEKKYDSKGALISTICHL